MKYSILLVPSGEVIEIETNDLDKSTIRDIDLDFSVKYEMYIVSDKHRSKLIPEKKWVSTYGYKLRLGDIVRFKHAKHNGEGRVTHVFSGRETDWWYRKHRFKRDTSGVYNVTWPSKMVYSYRGSDLLIREDLKK